MKRSAVLILLIIILPILLGCSASDAVYITGEITNLPHNISAVDDGESFMYSDLTDLGSGDTRELLLITSNSGLNTHLRYYISTEAESTFYLFEDTVVSANGTPVTTHNKNRNNTNNSTLLIYHTPTITSDGTQLQINKTGSGKSTGGAFEEADKIILKKNTKYLIRSTNDTVSLNWVMIEMTWHEHE